MKKKREIIELEDLIMDLYKQERIEELIYHGGIIEGLLAGYAATNRIDIKEYVNLLRRKGEVSSIVRERLNRELQEGERTLASIINEAER